MIEAAAGADRERRRQLDVVLDEDARNRERVLELRHVPMSSADLQQFADGIVVSAAVGYLTIKYFLRFLARHRLDVFAWYRLALAALTVVWLWRH